MEHGEDLIIIVDGVGAMASKSCSYEVDSETIEVSGPNSGRWKEYKTGRKSWKVSTNHLLYAGTKYRKSAYTGNVFTLNATNSLANGWQAWGNSTNYNFNEEGQGSGFTVMKINFQTGQLLEITTYSSDTLMKAYLQGSAFDTAHIGVLIFTNGNFILEDAVVAYLQETFHIPLPRLRYGYYLSVIDFQYSNVPLIMLGGKDITGESYTDEEQNLLKITFDGGTLSHADGRTGNVEMVGKKVSLMFKGKDGSLMAGEAICKIWKETDTKGSLSTGSFSWIGSGELQTNAAVQPRLTAEFISNTIYLNMNKVISTDIISGNVNGNIIKYIRANTHRYLGKYATRNGSTKMYLIQLDDTNSLKYADGTDVSWGEGNVGDWFVMMPQFWTKAEETSDGMWKITFKTTAPGQSETGWMSWGGNSQLIGAFQAVATSNYDNISIITGNNDNGCLRSIIPNGDTPLRDVEYDNLIAKIGNRNGGFSLVRMQDHNIMAMLFMAMYGNTNCQDTIGYGGDINYVVGQTASAGMQDLGGGGVINFMGLEAWWGGVAEYMQGVRTRGDVWTIGSRTVQASVTPTTDYYDPVVVFPKRMVIGDNLDMLPYPIQQGGVYNQGFCDGISMFTSQSNFEVARGRAPQDSLQASMGIFALTNVLPASSTVNNLGTRIVFSGTTEVLTDPATYEALTPIG